jgi:hypothetical protein
MGWGQSVEVGSVGGVPLTRAFDMAPRLIYFCHYEGATSATRRYIVGPEVRLSLPLGLGVEAGALYKRLGYDSVFELACNSVYARSIENSWEFPVLATYRLPGHVPGAPFVSAGPAFRFATNVSLTAYATYPGGSTSVPDPRNSTALLDHRSHAGVAAGVGCEPRAGRLRIRPEVRYTRWAPDSPQSRALHSNQNQVELLVGFGVMVRDRVP